jgi:HlyD family secretion protein
LRSANDMKKWLAPGALLLLLVVPLAIRQWKQGEPTPVYLDKVQPHLLLPSILASGSLIYQSEVKLVPEVIGKVEHIYVKEGDVVRHGQLLITLDSSTYRSEILRLRAAIRQAELAIARDEVNKVTLETKTKRYELLRSRGMVDASSFEAIAADSATAAITLNTSREMLNQARAQLQQALEQLAKTEFRSPIDGEITAITIKEGETAVPSATSIPGSDLMMVADTTSTYAEVNVDETDVAHVREGESAKIVPAAFPDSSWSGTVERVAVSPKQNPGQNKTYAVKIRVTGGPEAKFNPGMSCRAEIYTQMVGTAEVLSVPLEAIRYEEYRSGADVAGGTVFVFERGRAMVRAIQTGIGDDARIEVSNGLALGEEVVVGPPRTLRALKDGDLIKPVKAPVDGSSEAR